MTSLCVCTSGFNQNIAVRTYPGVPFSMMNAVIPFEPAALSVFA